MTQDTSKEKERLILGAARKRFAYYGFSKVTMDEIAGDVGLAKPSLYYYYPTKESLYRAVVAREQEKFVGELQQLVRSGIPQGEKLQEYVAARVQLFREMVNLNALNFKSWSELKSISGDLFRNLEEQELNVVREILSLGTASGEFTCADPQQMAEMVLHVLHGLRLRVFRQSDGMPVLEEAYEALQNESGRFVTVLLRALKSIC